MHSKTSLKITKKYSINFSLPKRQKKNIKFIIIHYTGMKKEPDSIKRLCDPKSKVSSHYYIKQNGEILSLVPDLYLAWHAGVSAWKNFKSLNKYSIGIEITNPGHEHGYKNFSLKQIFYLKKLLRFLIKKYNIENKCILGHSDVSTDRKKDPGEKFPWYELGKEKLCKWHTLEKKKIKKFRNVKLSDKKEEGSFLNNLNKIGYVKISKKKPNLKVKLLVKAFQRRFRQDLINGKIDKECFLISKSLLKS